MSKIEQMAQKTIGGRVTPTTYLVPYASWVIGFFFTFLYDTEDVQHSLIYNAGVLVGTHIWSPMLLTAATLVLIGLRFKCRTLVRIGAMAKFMLWLFVGIAFLQKHEYYAFFALGFLHIVNSAYLYLAARFGGLWRY